MPDDAITDYEYLQARFKQAANVRDELTNLRAYFERKFTQIEKQQKENIALIEKMRLEIENTRAICIDATEQHSSKICD